jgi:ABC-type cobalt transport system substrate-binding protein
MHIWQWEMTGSQGSTWNINPSAGANQPDNRPLAQWLSGWVSNLLPGDFNRDGSVDAADYVVWRRSNGQSTTFFTGADGNGSGAVDTADYNIWRSQFGAPASGSVNSSASVPEPMVARLILPAFCGFGAILLRARRSTGPA